MRAARLRLRRLFSWAGGERFWGWPYSSDRSGASWKSSTPLKRLRRLEPPAAQLRVRHAVGFGAIDSTRPLLGFASSDLSAINPFDQRSW